MNNSKIRVRFTGSWLKQDKVTFNPRSVVDLFIVYKLDAWSRDLKTDFTLKICLFGAIKLTKNADPDKCYYSGCGIGFDSRLLFSYAGFDWCKNVVIFWSISSVHIDNKKKKIS